MSCSAKIHSHRMMDKLEDSSLEPLISNSTESRTAAAATPRDYSTSKLGVIGTGNFAMALTKRLNLSGYQVVIGSRRPEARRGTLPLSRECLCGVELTTIADCLRRCDVIFVAMHMEDFNVTLGKYADDCRGKIMVDVSNRDYRYATISNAERLASILPHASIVKAFNTISAQAMEQFVQMNNSNQKVFVASNNITARNTVSEIAKSVGFMVIDLGGIKSARYMEESVLKVFSYWKIPIFLTFLIFDCWTLFVVYLYYIEKEAYSWEQIFLKVLNKPLCMTAITVLALTYLPGQLASILQVYRGTKHQRFPKVLDTWLQSRKQLGLISFVLVLCHVLASVMMLSPTYYKSWFHQPKITLDLNSTLDSNQVVTLAVSQTWMIWKGEAACVVGLIAFVMLCIVAVTSIPSVGESLNWSEWRCVHSRLSYGMLFVCLLHVCVMGAPGWVKNPHKIYKSITFLSSLLPLAVLILKFLFSIPPLSTQLRKIRRGWERTCKDTKVEAEMNGGHDLAEVKVTRAANLSQSCGCSQTKPKPVATSIEATSNERCQCSEF